MAGRSSKTASIQVPGDNGKRGVNASTEAVNNGAAQQAKVLLVQGSEVLAIPAGKRTVLKVQAGERYRIVSRLKDGEEEVLSQLEARRSDVGKGDDLILRIDETTELVLEGFFSECADQQCSVLLPSAEGYVLVDSSLAVAAMGGRRPAVQCQWPAAAGNHGGHPR